MAIGDKYNERKAELTAEENRAAELSQRERELQMQERQLALQERQLALQEAQLAIQQQQAESLEIQEKRSAPRENPDYRPVSVFNPEGKSAAELPQLKCKMFLGPFRLDRSPLLVEEIVALNRLCPIKGAQVRKNDGSITYIDIAAKLDVQGRLEELQILANMKKDQAPQAFPSLRNLAEQLAEQCEALTKVGV
jgi:hypothetical protein